MIDFHNHILPNADDGSNSVDMSLNMLREAESQGITDVVNTVHFQHPKMEHKDTSFNFITSEINKLQSIVNDHGINIKIHAGSEVFFNYNLTEILDNPITTIGNGKYMLVEFQTLSFPKDYDKTIFELQTKGVTPIIAHPERYRPIQNDITIVQGWIERGYIIQIDCGSLLGHFGNNTKKCAKKLVREGLCHVVGSDSHNDKKRNFCLKSTLDLLEKIIGKDCVDIISSNSKRVLNGHECKGYKKDYKNKSSFFAKIKKQIVRR